VPWCLCGKEWAYYRKKIYYLNYKSNPSLKTIKADWPGTPVDSNNRFVNVEYPFVPKVGDVFKWMTSRNPQKKEKKKTASDSNK